MNMNRSDIRKSGRCGGVVFFLIRNHQRERIYVVPATVRNAATGRARGAFGALSSAFNTRLTDLQRAAWNTAAAQVQSRPRLGQCGPLTGQQHFVGINSARARIDRPWLLWPPRPVVFGPNPVEGLNLYYVNGRLCIELTLPGPVVEDIMLFAQAPCRPGWKKWRHGICLGLLPPPHNGLSDITDLYLAAFGEPEPGKKIFIRTRQQRNGWEDQAKDLSELVPVKPLAAQRRTRLWPDRSFLPQPIRASPELVLGHSQSSRRPAWGRPFHPAILQPCTRDHRLSSTLATPLAGRAWGFCERLACSAAPLPTLRVPSKAHRPCRRPERWRGS